MRLRRLDLIRYGKFADASLDFGSAPDGPDVTVVYGPNEAGKSTAYAAWLDFLFGLPTRDHPHAFRFERKELMIGAVIETPDQSLTLRRTGSTKDPLTDDADRRVEESRLSTLLHGLDRNAYRTRFSLNDQILRDGGAEIATAQGDLGRLLHAGSSGLSGVTAELDAIETQIEDFHKKGRSASTLAKAKKALVEIEAQMADARLDPRVFDGLRSAVDTGEAEVATAKTARDTAHRATLLRDAADRTRDLTERIAALTAELENYPAGPDLPADAPTRAAAALTQRDAAQVALDAALARAATAQSALEASPTDAVGQEVAAILMTLEAASFDDGDPLLPRVLTATTDLGKRQGERRALLAQMDVVAKHTAGSGFDVADVLLSKTTLATLREAAQTARDTARQAADLTEAFESASATSEPVAPLPQGADALMDALAAYDQLTEDPQMLQADAGTALRAAGLAAMGLPPKWAELFTPGLPEDASLTALSSRLERLQQAHDGAARSLAEAEESHANLVASDLAEAAHSEIITDADLNAARTVRDDAWRVHRATLETATADAFANAMRHDDDLRATSATRAEARLRMVQRQVELAQSNARLIRRRADLDATRTALDDGLSDAGTFASALGFEVTPDVATLRDRRTALLQAGQAKAEAETIRSRAEATDTRHQSALANIAVALKSIGIEAPTDRLLPIARRTQAELEARATALRDRSVAADTLKTLTRDRSRAMTKAAAAQDALKQATALLWCHELDATAILERMPGMNDLAALDDKCRELDQRISRMETALNSFRALATNLTPMLGLEPGADATSILSAARLRATQAAQTAQHIEALKQTSIDATAEHAKQCAIRDRCSAILLALIAGQDVDPTTPAMDSIASLTRRDALRADLARLEAERARAGRGFDGQALAEEAALEDPVRTPALNVERQEAEAALEAAIDRRGKAHEALRQALTKTGAAKLDQDRATALESLREEARMQAAHLLGLMAARGALRRFRQDRRGEMLQATEAAFATMTGGEWPRLDTQPMGKTERLVGIRNDEAVAADAMSTGTRGQLYLALRIAGHADFIARHGPLPFVTDDIHETFDDARAQAAIALAGEMGRRGQVILFTHHRHLIDLARSAIPQVRVIDMPGFNPLN